MVQSVTYWTGWWEWLKYKIFFCCFVNWEKIELVEMKTTQITQTV